MKNALSVLVFMLALGLAIYAMQLMAPTVGDYFSFFRPSTLAFLRGESQLYDTASSGFYNAPWTLAIWLPFVGFPYWVGQSAHLLVYLLCLLGATALLQRDTPPVALLFALFNIPAFVVVVSSGIDPVILFGLALGYISARRRHQGLAAVSLFILTMKPQNVLLVMFLILHTLGSLKPLGLTAVAVIVSAVFAGPDWPLRLMTYMQSAPPLLDRRVELWQSIPLPVMLAFFLFAIDILIHYIRRDGFTEWTFALALAANMVFSPYVLWAHFVLLIPVLLSAARRNLRASLLLYASSWTVPLWGMAYPIVAFVLSWYYCRTAPVQSTVARAKSPALSE